MDKQTVITFLQELDNIASKNGNSQSAIFAKRARQIVLNAYDGDGKVRVKSGATSDKDFVDTSTADKLIEMGKVEAVYGSGRSLLRK